MSHNCDRTHEIINTTDLKYLRSSTTHNIFLCPFCEDKYGKPDTAGKLYIDKHKFIGLCFRCNTVVHVRSDDVDVTTAELLESIESYLSKAKRNQEFPAPEAIEFDFPDLDKEMLAYLQKRNPLLEKYAHALGLKAWHGSRKGVVIPFGYEDHVASFQVRFIDKEKKKYYTMPGAKILYSPYNSLTTFELLGDRKVTLCEGVFDAIALTTLGYPNPFAVLGKSLTNFQIYQLRRFMPEGAYIAMDSFMINGALAKQVRARIPTVTDIWFTNFDKLDPEEYLLKNFDSIVNGE